MIIGRHWRGLLMLALLVGKDGWYCWIPAGGQGDKVCYGVLDDVCGSKGPGYGKIPWIGDCEGIMPTRQWDEQYAVLRAQLRAIRQKAKLTQQVLADKLKKPQSYISKIESGERGCNLFEVRSICKACKTDFVKFVSALDKTLAKQVVKAE